MNGFEKNAHAAHSELKELFRKHGIETFLVVYRDPDDDSLWRLDSGSRFWRMGAVQDYMHDELRHSFNAER